MPRFVRALLRHYRHEIGGFNRSQKSLGPTTAQTELANLQSVSLLSQTTRFPIADMIWWYVNGKSLKSPDRDNIFCCHFAEFDGVGLNAARKRCKERDSSQRQDGGLDILRVRLY